MKRLALILLVVLLAISAQCPGGVAPTPTPYPTYTPYPTHTPYPTPTPPPTATPQPTPTNTPRPTNTPKPTDTPVPTKAPTFQKWNSNQGVAAFKSAGLEVEGVRPMTKDDYGLAPMTAVEGTRFLIPSLCSDCGGRLLSFATKSDLELMKTYYVELGRRSALFFSWVFVKDNILVQINGDLPEERARQYEAALNAMK